jgi:NodT family efflux transporter outer membrane factor (OMF) lipoprotein
MIVDGTEAGRSLDHARSRAGLVFAASLIALSMAGCAVGPDFKKPAPPAVAAYTDHPLAETAATPGVAGGEAQRFVAGADISGDWWTLFHSRPLNDLIDQALANNHDLKAAQAAVVAAHETTLAQRGAYYPNVSAGFSATRQRTSGALAPTPSTNAVEYSLLTPSVSVAYVPDVFGLNKRTIEGLKAQEQATRYQMVAAHLTLTSNLANAVIQYASLQTQADATRELVAINSKIVDALKYQVSKGYAGGLDLAAQQAQLAAAVATLPPLVKQLAQQRDAIAVLVGRFPSEAKIADFDLAGLQLPADLPLTLPSTLVAQRPDVLQAEANLHAASAQIGVATANRLPNIQLGATAGTSGLAVGQVFGPGSGFWTIGAEIAAPIFDGGALKHQQGAAKAAYVQADEQYRSTVLTAVQNVADTLVAIEQDAEGLKAAAAASDAAKVTLDLSQRQYKDGYAGYLSVLSAEQAWQQARIALVQAQASRYADTVALFQALGGGWWSRPDLARDTHAS